MRVFPGGAFSETTEEFETDVSNLAPTLPFSPPASAVKYTGDIETTGPLLVDAQEGKAAALTGTTHPKESAALDRSTRYDTDGLPKTKAEDYENKTRAVNPTRWARPEKSRRHVACERLAWSGHDLGQDGRETVRGAEVRASCPGIRTHDGSTDPCAPKYYRQEQSGSLRPESDNLATTHSTTTAAQDANFVAAAQNSSTEEVHEEHAVRGNSVSFTLLGGSVIQRVEFDEKTVHAGSTAVSSTEPPVIGGKKTSTGSQARSISCTSQGSHTDPLRQGASGGAMLGPVHFSGPVFSHVCTKMGTSSLSPGVTASHTLDVKSCEISDRQSVGITARAKSDGTHSLAARPQESIPAIYSSRYVEIQHDSACNSEGSTSVRKVPNIARDVPALTFHGSPGSLAVTLRPRDGYVGISYTESEDFAPARIFLRESSLLSARSFDRRYPRRGVPLDAGLSRDSSSVARSGKEEVAVSNSFSQKDLDAFTPVNETLSHPGHSPPKECGRSIGVAPGATREACNTDILTLPGKSANINDQSTTNCARFSMGADDATSLSPSSAPLNSCKTAGNENYEQDERTNANPYPTANMPADSVPPAGAHDRAEVAISRGNTRCSVVVARATQTPEVIDTVQPGPFVVPSLENGGNLSTTSSEPRKIAEAERGSAPTRDNSGGEEHEKLQDTTPPEIPIVHSMLLNTTIPLSPQSAAPSSCTRLRAQLRSPFFVLPRHSNGRESNEASRSDGDVPKNNRRNGADNALFSRPKFVARRRHDRWLRRQRALAQEVFINASENLAGAEARLTLEKR